MGRFQSVERQAVLFAGELDFIGGRRHRGDSVYSSAFRTLAQVGFQEEGRITALAGCRQRPLHNLLVSDGAAVRMKDKVHQISTLGKGPTTAAVTAASTSRHISHLMFLIFGIRCPSAP